MKSIRNKIIIISSVLIVIIAIGFIALLPKQHDVIKTFNDAFVTSDLKTKSGNSTMKINANILTRYSLKHFNTEKILNGNITIDDKKYILFGYNLGKPTNNVFFGDVKERSTDANPTYMFFISDDLKSIYLSGVDNKKYIAAPAKTINEFEALRIKMERRKS